MKKLYVLFIVILKLNIVNAQTNIYHPFPSDSLVFGSFKHSFNKGQGDSYFPETTMWLGDTVINGKEYTKCYNIKHWKRPNIYFGGVRQEIANEKVFFIDTNNVESDISVNQHLLIGDTLYGLPITKIDSVLWGDNYRKKYIMTKNDPGIEYDSSEYIVGVGTVYLLNAYGWEGAHTDYSILCYYVENVPYINYNYQPCDILSGFFDKTNQIQRNQIYPNPMSTKLTIETTQLTITNTLIILNINGQELIRQQIKESKTQIDVSNLTSGIYFVKLITDKTVEVRKIIKE